MRWPRSGAGGLRPMTEKTEMAELDLDLTEQQLLQEALSRRAEPLNQRERRAELLTGGAFVLAVGRALGAVRRPRRVQRTRRGGRARWESPSPCASASTSPASTPSPPSWRSSRCCSACRPRRSRRSRSSRSRPAGSPRCCAVRFLPSRLVLSIANGWFAVGPVVVLLLAGGAARRGSAHRLLIAGAVRRAGRRRLRRLRAARGDGATRAAGRTAVGRALGLQRRRRPDARRAAWAWALSATAPGDRSL